MPSLFGGFGNYFVPIFQGSPEVVYPRVNNFSILILFLSYLFFILSLISEFGDEERRLMHLVPAPAVRLMKRQVLSRPGVNSL